LRVFQEHGLILPTEAQWEHAARAGEHGPAFRAKDAATLLGSINLLDLTAEESGMFGGFPKGVVLQIHDGYVVHAPVDKMKANPWGLHSVLGNVQELCFDFRSAFYSLSKAREGDGFRPLLNGPERVVVRGSSYQHLPGDARISSRDEALAGACSGLVGLRAARALQHLDR
jgi:formylglycine-generating enzyme required for sulfatase activity